MTNESLKKIILKNRVFSSANNKTLCGVLRCRREMFNTGENIYSTERFERCFGIVLSGKVDIFGASNDKKVRLNSISSGDSFGAAALFGTKNGYVSTLTAKTKCEVLFITESEMRDFIMNDSAVAMAYVIFLSEKVRFLNGKITSFTAKNADAAVAGYLSEQNSDEFEINMSRLSRQLDIGRTSLYRSFENLIRSGAISYSERKVVIKSRKILDNVRNN